LNKKQKTILAVFNEKVGASTAEVAEFTNTDVKRACAVTKFGNPFDATKFDESRRLPPELVTRGYCILHLGRGRHAFVRALDKVYHALQAPAETKDWKYTPSPLNGIETSEAWQFSFVFNHRLAHDFLWDTQSRNPFVYTQKRTKMTIDFRIGSLGLKARGLMVEIDGTICLPTELALFEFKNGIRSDFNLAQLFFPNAYMRGLQAQGKLDRRLNIRLVYAVRVSRQASIDFHEFAFSDHLDMESIRLVKSRRYNLIGK